MVVWPQLDTGLGRYLLLMAVVTPAPALRLSFVKRYAALLLVSGVIGWSVAPTRWCAKSNHTASPTQSCRWA